MSLRPLKLPDDIRVAQTLIPAALQHPDTNWTTDPMDMEDMLAMLRFLDRFWKVIQLARWVSPTLRDNSLGYVWEMEQQPVGMIVVDRVPNTSTWRIAVMVVLAPFRNRGIGARLINALIGIVKEQGGKKLIVELPGSSQAGRHLFQRMGFKTYDGVIEYDYVQLEPPPELDIPQGYSVGELPYFAWEPRFQLANRIIPEFTKRFEPLTAQDFRRPYLQYGLRRAWLRMQGVTETELAVRRSDGEIVARGGYAIRSRWGDISEVAMRVDPDYHQTIAPYLLHHLVRDAQKRGRRRRVEMLVPIWQPKVIELVESVGFEQVASFYKLGLLLT